MNAPDLNRALSAPETQPLSPAAFERFAREVAKYPGDQKQSAVMACLAIVQQEQGWVSAASEASVAAYLACRPWLCTR